MSADRNPTDALSFRLAADYVEDNYPAKNGHREVPGLGLTAGEQVLDDIYDTRAAPATTTSCATRACRSRRPGN